MVTQTKFVNVLIGVPASGKSTYIKELREKHGDVKIISRDNVVMSYAKMFDQTYDEAFVEFAKQINTTYNQTVENTKRSIRYGEEKDYIIFDKTNLHSHVRDKEYGYFQSNGYKLIYTFFEKPVGDSQIKEWFDRMRGREGKTIPDHVMWKMYNDYVDIVPDDAKIKPNEIVRINNWKGKSDV